MYLIWLKKLRSLIIHLFSQIRSYFEKAMSTRTSCPSMVTVEGLLIFLQLTRKQNPYFVGFSWAVKTGSMALMRNRCILCDTAYVPFSWDSVNEYITWQPVNEISQHSEWLWCTKEPCRTVGTIEMFKKIEGWYAQTHFGFQLQHNISWKSCIDWKDWKSHDKKL